MFYQCSASRLVCNYRHAHCNKSFQVQHIFRRILVVCIKCEKVLPCWHFLFLFQTLPTEMVIGHSGKRIRFKGEILKKYATEGDTTMLLYGTQAFMWGVITSPYPCASFWKIHLKCGIAKSNICILIHYNGVGGTISYVKNTDKITEIR